MLFDLLDLYVGGVLKWQAIPWWHWGKRFCTVAVEIFQERVHWVGSALPWRWSWNGRPLCCDTWGRNCIFTVQVSKNSLLGRWSSKGHLLVTLGKSLHILCSGLSGHRVLRVSTVIFKRCLEMVGDSVVTVEEDYTLDVEVSQVSTHLVSIVLLRRWPWNGRPHSSDIGVRGSAPSLLRCTGTQNSLS